MQVKILSEHGYNEALFGLGLSHGVTSGLEYKTDFTLMSANILAVCRENEKADAMKARYNRMEAVAQKLADRGNGHDKFLRQICVWLDITAPRYFWPEMDQYKVATVTQSESTMHTIHKQPFTQDMFQDGDVPESYLEYLNELREKFLQTKDKEVWKKIIKHKPESYLQRRILTCNYAPLRNIIEQRTGHRLSEWAVFIDSIRSQCQHPELLP